MANTWRAAGERPKTRNLAPTCARRVRATERLGTVSIGVLSNTGAGLTNFRPVRWRRASRLLLGWTCRGSKRRTIATTCTTDGVYTSVDRVLRNAPVSSLPDARRINDPSP